VFLWAPIHALVIDRDLQLLAGWNVDKLCANKERFEQATDH
jgi:hypothetical protein